MFAYKFRIYPNKQQKEFIAKTFGCVRFVYNYYLDKRINAYKNDNKTLTYYDCNNDCNNVLKKENEWLREVDKWALNNSLLNLDNAYKNFFRRVKQKKGKLGFPKFKSKHNNKLSYKTNGIKIIEENFIKVPKIKPIKAKFHREILGKPKSAVIFQTKSGKYYISILTDYKTQTNDTTGGVIGLDLGIKDFAIDSNGNKYPNNKYLDQSLKKLARAQKALSRKPNGSNNKNKARIKIAKIYEKVANQQKDFCHKLSTKLVRENDLICIEDLQVTNMIKNHRLARNISQVCWGKFVEFLEYKCQRYGKILQKVGKFFASSQLCGKCGYKNTKIKNLSIRKWTCPQCGTQHDRDINAAKNILIEGLRLVKI